MITFFRNKIDLINNLYRTHFLRKLTCRAIQLGHCLCTSPSDFPSHLESVNFLILIETAILQHGGTVMKIKSFATWKSQGVCREKSDKLFFFQIFFDERPLKF